MDTNQRGQQLHDKATRNLPLSVEEQAELDLWYRMLDGEEQHLLDKRIAPPTIESLQTQVVETVAQLHVITQQIELLSQANTVLRQGIAILQRNDVGRLEE